MTDTGTREVQQQERHIPPPTGDREPLKVNVYERMQHTNSQLIPLFPYHGPNAMVPCGSIFRGEPGLDMGHFFHRNTQDEIVQVFGGNKAMLPTGAVVTNAKLHGVNAFLKEPNDPEAYLVVTITQRQGDGDEQAESLLFRCRKCHAHLYEATFASIPGSDQEHLPRFPSITETVAPTIEFNAEHRTCPECGFENDEFPLERWGWAQWSMQRTTVNEARDALLQVAADSLEDAG